MSYLDGNPAGNWAGNLPGNSAGYGESYGDSNSAVRSESRPDNRPEWNRDGNLQSNGEDCRQSYSAASPMDCSESYPESFERDQADHLDCVLGRSRQLSGDVSHGLSVTLRQLDVSARECYNPVMTVCSNGQVYGIDAQTMISEC